MAKVRDVNRKDDSASKNGKKAPDEENANKGGSGDDESQALLNLDLFRYVRKSREKRGKGRESKTTDLSSNIGGDTSPSNNTTNLRRRAEHIIRIVFVAVVVLAILTALVVTLRIVVFSPNGDNGTVKPVLDLTADKDNEKTNMVITEVTERSLTSIEINGAGEKDDLALARASAGLGGKQELSAIHGTRKRRLQELCDPCEYYKPIYFWTRNSVQRLLEGTQEIVPYFGANGKNTRAALISLDRVDGSSNDVHLIYSNKTGVSQPGAFTWNREHVWTCDRGVKCSAGNPDYTDLHNLFPADEGVDGVKANRFFDNILDDCTDGNNCMLLEEAIKYGGENDAFQPPEAARGVVARALFYMDLRYPHIELTDDPDPGKKNQMAYKSTLLKWHESYPPEAREIERNNRTCSEWQGNRNPFIDFPDLAGILHGNTKTKVVKDPFPNCIEEATTFTPLGPAEIPSPVGDAVETIFDEPSSSGKSQEGPFNRRSVSLKLVECILLLSCLYFFV